MRILTRLNQPWIHFILLGLVLFQLQRVFFPEPRPVVGPLSDARVATLKQQWVASTGALPQPEQLSRIVDAELDRDMLFQRALDMELHLYDSVVYQRLLRNMYFLGLNEGNTEQQMYEQALEMRLHLGDEVIKRRLIQVMEQLLLASNPPAPVTESDVEQAFAARREELRRQPRYSIEQLYFKREREAEVPQVIATIAREQLSPADALKLSSPFLPGYEFRSQTPEQLARHFGAAFVMNLEQAMPRAQTWVGPVRSTYGLHYVWVDAIESAREANLEEVRAQLTRDLDSQHRAQALDAAIGRLRQEYEVRK